MRGVDHQQSQMFSYLSPETRVRKDRPLRAISGAAEARLMSGRRGTQATASAKSSGSASKNATQLSLLERTDWSRSEKAIARRAFDAALARELHEVIQEAKKMASQIQQSSDLWDLEHYLTERRKEIVRKYDYRYSHLTDVFVTLLHESRLSEEELRGLREDKLKLIRSFAKFLARTDVA